MEKRIMLCVVGGLLFFSSYSQGEKAITSTKENFIYISPINLFMNTFELGYEKKLNNHNTLSFAMGYILSKENKLIKNIGGTGEVQYRINLLYNKEAISIVSRKYSTFAYFAPYFNFHYEEITEPNYYEPLQPSYNITTFIDSYFGGAGFGCRISGIENRFTINIFLGGGLKYSNIEGNDQYSDFLKAGYTGIAPKAGFQMGIAF